MPTAREVREKAASAALAGVAADPLAETVEGEQEAGAAIQEPDGTEIPGVPESGPPADTWEQEGFRFELIDSPEGQEIKMTPIDGSGETISITDPEEIEFILQQRGGQGVEVEEEQIVER